MASRDGKVLPDRHDGQITGITSSPGMKNILFYRIDDQVYNSPSPRHQKGRFAIVTERGAGCDGRCCVRCFGTGRKRRSVRRSRVVLAPRPWRYAGGIVPAGNGGKKGRFPGESTYKP